MRASKSGKPLLVPQLMNKTHRQMGAVDVAVEVEEVDFQQRPGAPRVGRMPGWRPPARGLSFNPLTSTQYTPVIGSGLCLIRMLAVRKPS